MESYNPLAVGHVCRVRDLEGRPAWTLTIEGLRWAKEALAWLSKNGYVRHETLDGSVWIHGELTR